MIKLGVPYTGIPSKLDIINTREDEAIAMAVGIELAGKEARVYMQDDGLLNALNTAATLVMPYKIDCFLTVAQRNTPEHHAYANHIAKELWEKYFEKQPSI